MKESELLYKFGQRLKELRDSKKWSLRDLETFTGIDHSDLSCYESGYIGPQLVTLYKLSQALIPFHPSEEQSAISPIGHAGLYILNSISNLAKAVKAENSISR